MFAKSQVTIMIILALVILIAAGFVLYLLKAAVNENQQVNIEHSQGTSIDTNPVRQYISKCLETTSKKAITLIGKQGGYIYKSQKGPIIDYIGEDEGNYFVKNGDTIVSYNIMAPRFKVLSFLTSTPEYPWESFPYSAKASLTATFEGYFGINTMPPLQTPNGPNSIEYQIEYYVDNNLKDCIKLEEIGKEYDISLGNPSTNVKIGNDIVTIDTKMETEMTNPVTKETTKMRDFSVQLDVRLKSAYYYVRDLISKDISNIRFNISARENDQSHLVVRISKDINGRDDLVKVTDDKSIMDGRPFEYHFARKNRAPALYYIKKNVYEYPRDYLINMSDIIDVNDVKAEDPDEDEVHFGIYVGRLGTEPVAFPVQLEAPSLDFRIEVSDFEREDYQIINIKRKDEVPT